MLRWEWFRIYFESGIVKLASGDPHWRDFTAMDEYYQNGPLPTWIGWYVQHLPHWYHAATVAFTLVVELLLVWAVFLSRPFRLACAAVVAFPLSIGVEYVKVQFSTLPGVHLVLYGLLLIIVMIYRPGGVAGIAQSLDEWWQRRRLAPPAEAAKLA